MKVNVLIVSVDEFIVKAIKTAEPDIGLNINIYKKTNEPIELVFDVVEKKPGVVVLDDDYLKPNSIKILKSIKKFDKNLATIFLTSDTSIRLGREVTIVGTKYYGIKPITEIDLINLIKSIAQLRAKVNLFKTKQEK